MLARQMAYLGHEKPRNHTDLDRKKGRDEANIGYLLTQYK